MIEFEEFELTDLPLVHKWLGEPHVSYWWRDPATTEEIDKDFTEAADPTNTLKVFIVKFEGEPIGFIQAEQLRYWGKDFLTNNASMIAEAGLDEAVGIDYVIGVPEMIGKGIGSQMISEFVRHFDRNFITAKKFSADPLQENVASWRALEKAGFTRVWEGNIVDDAPSNFGPSYIYKFEI